MDITEVSGFLLVAGGRLVSQGRYILTGLWFVLGIFDMASVLAKILLFSFLGLILKQGMSDVGKLQQTFPGNNVSGIYPLVELDLLSIITAYF